MGYRVFDHTADLGIDISGGTIKELYAEAALALFDLLAERTTIRAQEERAIVAEGEDAADLLVNFLREVLFAWNGAGFLGTQCVVEEVTSRRLTAVLRGERYDPTRHRITTEIKAVTYHQASVHRGAQEWTARVVFDV